MEIKSKFIPKNNYSIRIHALFEICKAVNVDLSICILQQEEKELETKENDLQQKDITIAEKDRLLSEVKENAMKEKESFEGIIKNHEEAMRNLQRKLVWFSFMVLYRMFCI